MGYICKTICTNHPRRSRWKGRNLKGGGVYDHYGEDIMYCKLCSKYFNMKGMDSNRCPCCSVIMRDSARKKTNKQVARID